MLDLIWENFQQRRIKDAFDKANGAKEVAVTTGTAIGALNSQIETLVLANQAMWELLSEKAGLTETDLINKMNEVDLRDGKLDGKIAKKVVRECGDCGHKVSKQRSVCYWCGAALQKNSPFSKY